MGIIFGGLASTGVNIKFGGHCSRHVACQCHDFNFSDFNLVVGLLTRQVKFLDKFSEYVVVITRVAIDSLCNIA